MVVRACRRKALCPLWSPLKPPTPQAHLPLSLHLLDFFAVAVGCSALNGACRPAFRSGLCCGPPNLCSSSCCRWGRWWPPSGCWGGRLPSWRLPAYRSTGPAVLPAAAHRSATSHPAAAGLPPGRLHPGNVAGPSSSKASWAAGSLSNPPSTTAGPSFAQVVLQSLAPSPLPPTPHVPAFTDSGEPTNILHPGRDSHLLPTSGVHHCSQDPPGPSTVPRDSRTPHPTVQIGRAHV